MFASSGEMTPPCGVPCAFRLRSPSVALVDDRRLEKRLHQRQHGAVHDSFRHRLHQAVVWDRVEVGFDVGVDDPAHPLFERVLDGVECLVRAPLRAKSERILIEVRLEKRFEYQLRRHLHHSVADVGDPQRPLPAPELRDVHPPDRSRSVPLRLQLIVQAPPAAPRFHASRCPRRSRRRARAPRRSPSPARRRGPAHPAGRPCRTARTLGSSAPSWHAGTAPVAAPGASLEFLSVATISSSFPAGVASSSRAPSLQRLSPPSSVLRARPTPRPARAPRLAALSARSRSLPAPVEVSRVQRFLSRRAVPDTPGERGRLLRDCPIASCLRPNHERLGLSTCVYEATSGFAARYGPSLRSRRLAAVDIQAPLLLDASRHHAGDRATRMLDSSEAGSFHPAKNAPLPRRTMIRHISNPGRGHGRGRGRGHGRRR